MKLKRNSKERLRKKRELEKQQNNEWYNNFIKELKKNFIKELNKNYTLWQRIKIYINNLIK
jgi:hypothetical protein